MNDIFLIPANSKKSALIFGWFYTFDLILFGSGLGLTLLLMAILPLGEVVFSIIAIIPAGTALLLVFPVPNYHNVLTVIISIWTFLTTRRSYIWKGWCVADEQETDKE